MNQKENIREFSMKYCPNLHDHVVVMSSGKPSETQTKTCLSSHLCHTDARASCGHETAFSMANEENMASYV